MYFKRIKHLLLPSGALSAALFLSGCAGFGGGAPDKQVFEPGKSFAYNVSVLSYINRAKHVEDVELAPGDVAGVDVNSGVFDAALGAGMLRFPSSIGSSGMNSMLAAGLVLNFFAGEESFAVHRDASVAWFPVSEASSREDAALKLHMIKVNGVKKSLDDRKIKYEIVNNIGIKNFRDDKRHYSYFKFNDMLGGACVEARAGDSCQITIGTRVPAKGTVLAPKELTGKSFEAYLFVGVKGESGYMQMSTVRDVDGKKLAFRLRGFDALRFLSENNKDWMVNYLSIPMQRALKSAKEEGVEFVNPFPYMVHKGEVKLFVVEK